MTNDEHSERQEALGPPVQRPVGRMTPARTLLADVARCSGVEEEDGWREGCADCLRRTDRGHFPQNAWIAPPALVVFECQHRIEP